MTKEISSNATWAQLDAMTRSHDWRIMRGGFGGVDSRKCRACGATSTTVVSYCGGTLQTDIGAPTSVPERHIDVPALEKTDGML